MFRRAIGLAAVRAVWREVLLFMVAAGVLLLLLLWPLSVAGSEALAAVEPLTAEERQLLDAYRCGELIRLHVLANSDAAEDQRVKLAVRDALLAAFGERLAKAGTQDAWAVYALLAQSVEEMQAVAEACARENGFTGEVSATVGRMRLPEKAYGRITLPEGEYRALRVTLGSGEGHNWWCVLFPQLCLAVADDDPWQAADADEPTLAGGGEATQAVRAAPMEAQEVVWECGRIFERWLALGV
ncbi:MAG: stage II sporulation protein R [Clostridia bacterium]